MMGRGGGAAGLGAPIRFEPGDRKTVELIPFGGQQRVYGFNGHDLLGMHALRSLGI